MIKQLTNCTTTWHICDIDVTLVLVRHVGSSARISKKVQGETGFEIGYFFNAHPIFKGDTTCRAVIVPGTTIGSGGEIPPIPPVIRALVVRCGTRK